MKKQLPIILVICLSYLLFIIVSPNNLGVGPDSVTYVESARNIASGNGYIANNQYVTHWPPGYSILLSMASNISNTDVTDVGKYLHVLLFILLGIIFKLILDELRFNIFVKYALLVLLLSSRPMTVSLVFGSELPFILFIVFSFLCFLKWGDTHNRSMLFFAGILSLFAFLTRYAAVGIVGGFLINLLLDKHRTYRIKFFDILYYLIPLFIGIGIWFYYTRLYSISTTNRSIVVHIIRFEKILNLIKTFIVWFAMDIKTLVVLVLFLLTATFLIYTNKDRLQSYVRDIRINTNQILIIILSYISFLLFSISFFDSYTPLDNRILSPLSPFLYLLLGYLLNFISINTPKWKSAVVMLMILYCGISSAKQIWVGHYENGNGYTSKEFSPYFDVIKERIASYEGETYSNGNDLIRFVSNNKLKLREMPEKFEPTTEIINNNYTSEIDEMKKNVLQNHAQVVYFDKITWRLYFPDKEELLNDLNAENSSGFEGGVIFKANAQQGLK